ncbi:MAG TPA: nucleotidyltransferase family protein [Noviherbaspirillum sp.]|uniref:nucleotidyltransferase family protein n=1 Tax=Noviherbaspirillum sp. TaxID=1926288 RepID=UPI002D4621BF|nr:nucleotidyltransferase family protein [Noviherbaspirillum sp.]HYD96505.1 nucleotidyltransferase family protein [Noviherbaspirillum sp.]
MQEKQICDWIAADPLRMRALHIARALDLPDWCIAAGFVRNLVWDKLHGYAVPTPLDDIDLVYFDPAEATGARDRCVEEALAALDASLPWSVRNQARMHTRNDDPPYLSTADAMRYWVEQETAVGVRLEKDGALRVVAVFGLDSLLAGRITPNRGRRKAHEFAVRLTKKDWLRKWPDLRVDA